MTRIDMTTREWHELIKPVLPHVSTDAEVPEICVVRIEGTGNVVNAVGTDRYTIAATRHLLATRCDDFAISIDRADAAAMLRLFAYGKDYDPQLRILIDKVPVPINGGRDTVNSLGLTIESDEGTRLILHGRQGATGNWRKLLAPLVHRELVPAADRLLLMPAQLGRWSAAAVKGERLTVLAGPKHGDPILILVEDHFAGAWMPANHIDGDTDDLLQSSPWRTELSEIPQVP